MLTANAQWLPETNNRTCLLNEANESNRNGVFDSTVTFHQWELEQAICCLLIAAIYDAGTRPTYDASKQREDET